MIEKDQRKAQRIAVELPAQITTENSTVLHAHTWDFSDNGVYVSLDENEIEMVPLHSKVKIQLIGTNYDTPILSGEVVRVTVRGIAIHLEDVLEEGNADSGYE